MRKLAGYALFAAALVSAPMSGELLRYSSGSDIDVSPKLHGPYLILEGGGGDQESAMQAAIDGVRGCTDCRTTLDVVILRASGAEGYNPFFMALEGVNSVVSLVITDRPSAEREDVVQTVRNAEIVFFAGGDQCNYIRWIKGTRTAEAVKSVYRRGGAVGGSSAGLAIQGEIVYDSCPNQSAVSRDVLVDPYGIDVSLSRDFFNWPPMRGVITDTHFSQRDRMGRLLVFMARALADGYARRLKGVGISEATVLLVDRNGMGRVMGKGPVHIVLADGRQPLNRGAALTYRGYRVWRFETGATIDLRHDPSGTPKIVDVLDGKLGADPY